MADTLEYSTKGETPVGRIGRVYIMLVCLCYLGAAVGEVIMSSSPNRFDPWVDWAVFFAHVSAATSGVLFAWGLVEITRKGLPSIGGLVRAAWIGSGALPAIVIFFTHNGGPLLYR